MLLRSACKVDDEQAMATEKTYDVGLEILIEEINNFIDENPVSSTAPLSTLESNIKKAEEMRFSIRLKSREEGNDSTHKSYISVMNSIKSYIKHTRQTVIDSRTREEVKSSFIHRQSILFEISDLDTKLRFIEQKLLRDVEDLPDEEVENVKTDAVASNKTLEKVSDRILKLIAGSTISDSEKIEKVKKRYEEIILSQKHFSDKLDSEYKKRELGKLKSFNQSKLNIQLSKFKGYTSCLDIYSFKRDFDKLHEKSVPTCLMADVLKNNYLEGAALALVKHENDISEIWKRLKTAYGDVKFLLSNKLSELSNSDKLWKLKDSAIISESLSKVINVIKDLMNLAETHNIEPRLYHGDGVTKEDKVSRLYLSNHQEKNPNYCYICGATDHISTNGPNNSKLIQWADSH